MFFPLTFPSQLAHCYSSWLLQRGMISRTTRLLVCVQENTNKGPPINIIIILVLIAETAKCFCKAQKHVLFLFACICFIFDWKGHKLDSGVIFPSYFFISHQTADIPSASIYVIRANHVSHCPFSGPGGFCDSEILSVCYLSARV